MGFVMPGATLGIPVGPPFSAADLRDPLKAAASRFQFKVNMAGQKDLVFDEWIERDWIRNRHTQQIAGVESAARAIEFIHSRNVFVGLTDRFDESLLLMKAMVASDLRLSYKRVNVARDNTLATELLETERTREMLIEAQKEDLALYEYASRELFPGYRRAYGHSLEEDLIRFRESGANGFNEWNRALSRLKDYGIYRPLLKLYRRGNEAA